MRPSAASGHHHDCVVHRTSRIVQLFQRARFVGAGRLGVCLIFSLATCGVTATARSDETEALDASFQTLAALEQGGGLEAFLPIRQAVARSLRDDQVRQDLEARLVAILQGDVTELARDYACRQLAIVGSEASIPALAELLPNLRSSYMARYALEGIGGSAVAQKLRDLLGSVGKSQKVGIVISLGRLSDADAVPLLAAILDELSERDELDEGDEEDTVLREVVVIALGRIGTVPAANALRGFVEIVPDELRNVAIDAEIHAMDSLCQPGEFSAAVELGESLLSDDSERVRAAAFRRLIVAKPHESLAMILDGLAAEEPWKRAVAADCVAQLRSSEKIKTIALAVPELPVNGKIAALISLRDRNDPAVREAALAALVQPDTDSRVAALAALITSGTAQDVSALADLAATDSDSQVRDAAFETLRLMTAEGTNAAIIAQMHEAAKPNPILIRCALARRSPEFVPSFLRAAESPSGAARLEAFKALEIMATEKDVASLVDLLAKTSPGEEREAAGRAVWMSCQRIPDLQRRAEPLLAAMGKANAAGQCAILPSLARMGGERSLAAVRKAMQSKDLAVRDAGHRALANWPDATVADDLLSIAKTSENASYRVWSLRAYARVVSLPNERPPQETFEMLRTAMKLATRTEDKALIVSRLGSVRTPESLALLASLLDDEQLSSAVVPAVFVLAKGLSQTDPTQAKAALERIQTMTTDEALLQQIPKVLRDIEARKP